MGESLRFDSLLLWSVFALLLIGLVMVASSSVAIATHNYHMSSYFLIKQSIFAVFGLGVALSVLAIPTRYWQAMGPLWLMIGIVLLILVLVPGIGRVVNGSRRWIHLGPIAVQVSELVKLCGVMYISGYLVRHGDLARETFLGVIKPIGLLVLMALLLLLQPDFGATVVLFVTVLGIMFMAGVRLRWFFLLIVGALSAGAMLVVFSPYRLARLTGFLHPWKNQFDTGYQLTQSLIAFGRGGWCGVGLGNSIQKLFYLPEAHTDFIFAIIAEELGFIGVMVIILLFAIVVWRGLKIARDAERVGALFDAYVAYGITFWLGLQVIVNIGVSIGLLPTKGLTLPFISYGGSSLVVDLMVIGILLRISFQNKCEQLGLGKATAGAGAWR